MRVTADSRLPRDLFAAWAVLLICGSLYPWSGWQDQGVPWFAFLTSGWPRHQTAFDLASNVLAYLPLGFFALAIPSRWAATARLLLVLVAGSLLSLALETAQNFLPSRVPSLADWTMNTLGVFLGGLAGILGGKAFVAASQALGQGGRRMSVRCHDAGLVLLGLWLLSQCAADTLLFGNGAWRGLLDLPALLPFSAERQLRFEMALVTAQTLAVMTMTSLVASQRPFRMAFLLVATALALKSGALAFLMPSAGLWFWVTPGTLAGLALGVFLWLVVLPLAAPVKQALAALALMIAVAVINLMPDNPYHLDTLRGWQQGPYFNFNGLVRLLAALWPYLALPWLILCRSRT